MNRRQFVGALAGAGITATLDAQDSPPQWGNPVIDMHHHWRTPVELNLAHMNGAGITRALLLTEAPQDAQQRPCRRIAFRASPASTPRRRIG